MSATIAELSSVTKAYGAQTVVHEVSFTLTAGERVALLGHNGAGKTTLMKMMLGVAPVTAGTIRVLGHEPASAPPNVRRSLGFLPENVAFDPAMTGREMLAFYAGLKHRPNSDIGTLLEQVGLADAAKRRVGTYSKGMRQRLGLAQALLGSPRLLLLDEPTSGLDPELRLAFYAILAERARDGAAVMLSSHLLTELEERTDRILIMDRGRLAAAGTLAELRIRAGRPVRLHAMLADGTPLETTCAPADKMARLRELATRPDVRDIVVEPPSLDDLYAHYTGGEGSP